MKNRIIHFVLMIAIVGCGFSLFGNNYFIGKDLVDHGYTPVDLQINPCGNLEFVAYLNGKSPMRFMIDFQENSLFDTGFLRSQNVKVQKTTDRVATPFGELSIYSGTVTIQMGSGKRIKNITLNPTIIPLERHNHVRKGCGRIDGIFASDLLTKYGAVFDYVHKKMYLKLP